MHPMRPCPLPRTRSVVKLSAPLGAMLLDADRAAEAEAVYREELRRNPGNGWSLHGLALSLRAQGKADAAAQVEREQRDAWQHADVQLVASRF